MKKNKILLLSMLMVFFWTISAAAVKAAENQQIQTDADCLIENGTYKVVSAVNNDYVWDISEASVEEGANLQLYEDNGTDAQKFTFTYLSNGYYSIINENSDKALECSGCDQENRVNIQQGSFKNEDTQCWKLVSVEDGYYTLICKNNGMAADLELGIAENGRNIQAFELNQTTAQEFRFVKTNFSVSSESLNSYSSQAEHSRVFSHEIIYLILGIGGIFMIGIGLFARFGRRKEAESCETNENGREK